MRSVSNNAIGICILLAFFLCTVPNAFAQFEDFEPIPFNAPIDLPRGTLTPKAADGLYLNDRDACKLVTSIWGWQQGRCNTISRMIISPTNSVDALVVEVPNSEGFVAFDDWAQDDRDSVIQSIWDSLKSQTNAQAKNLGITIELDEWLIRPTLDQDNQYLYYATQMTWDGERVINIKATVFDRRGYVSFLIIPADAAMSAHQVKSTIKQVLSAYNAKGSETYANFTEGDKVASAGVLGVLAVLVGVKNGKVLASGLLATLVAFSKKLWFLLFIPIVALIRQKNR